MEIGAGRWLLTGSSGGSGGAGGTPKCGPTYRGIMASGHLKWTVLNSRGDQVKSQSHVLCPAVWCGAQPLRAEPHRGCETFGRGPSGLGVLWRPGGREIYSLPSVHAPRHDIVRKPWREQPTRP